MLEKYYQLAANLTQNRTCNTNHWITKIKKVHLGDLGSTVSHSPFDSPTGKQFIVSDLRKTTGILTDHKSPQSTATY